MSGACGLARGSLQMWWEKICFQDSPLVKGLRAAPKTQWASPGDTRERGEERERERERGQQEEEGGGRGRMEEEEGEIEPWTTACHCLCSLPREAACLASCGRGVLTRVGVLAGWTTGVQTSGCQPQAGEEVGRSGSSGGNGSMDQGGRQDHVGTACPGGS